MKKPDSLHEVRRFPSFETQLKKLTKKFKNSANDIEAILDSLAESPTQGEQIQMGPIHARKLRIPLKAYKIGKSGGLRLVFILQEDLKRIIPVAIYFKGDINKDGEANNFIREQLKAIIKELDDHPEETTNKKPEASD